MRGLQSDPDAEYAQVIELDAAEITPMVATPGDPGNGKYVRDLNTPVPVEMLTAAPARPARTKTWICTPRCWPTRCKHGQTGGGLGEVLHSVRLAGDAGVLRSRRATWTSSRRPGREVIEPSCGACINAGPGVSTRPEQIVISAQNRNFPGRSGPGQMYLASPLTVAASAVAGYIVEYQPSQSGTGREPRLGCLQRCCRSALDARISRLLESRRANS